MNITASISLTILVFCASSILTWKQPGCPDNINTDVFYRTVATGPLEIRKNWLCEESFQFRVHICSSLYKNYILREFDYEKIKVAKHEDEVLTEHCVPYKMRFRDEEVRGYDMRVDVRMFRCPVKFKVEDPELVRRNEVSVREFFIARGMANQTITLLLTSVDKNEKRNICLEEIFWYNDTKLIEPRTNLSNVQFGNKEPD